MIKLNAALCLECFTVVVPLQRFDVQSCKCEKGKIILAGTSSNARVYGPLRKLQRLELYLKDGTS
jgi:hypothetical protein